MNKVKLKICGITCLEDATMAVKLGANALGFIFAPSPRQIGVRKARRIIRAIPPFVMSVGVFVNEAAPTIKEIMQHCSLDRIQLHGDESPAFCDEFMPYAIKSIRVKDESCLQISKAYYGSVRALLLDTYSDSMAGGTGKTFDWQLAIQISKQGTPIILSGGLRPANIAAAIHLVRPYAVDVNSGVESRPGKKSYTLIKSLAENVRQATFAGHGVEGESSDD